MPGNRPAGKSLSRWTGPDGATFTIVYSTVVALSRIVTVMPAPAPLIFPQEQRALTALGQRIRLARLRRKLSMAIVATRADISRTTLYAVESGDAACTLGTYYRVFSVLSLRSDFDLLAADDGLGRKLQDLGLEPTLRSRAPRAARPYKPKRKPKPKAEGAAP